MFAEHVSKWAALGRSRVRVDGLAAEQWLVGLPLNCTGSFSDFSDCSASCGGGLQRRMYIIQRFAKFGGGECSHTDGEVDEAECNTLPCPVDCVLADWAPDPAGCDQMCGGGHANETRAVEVGPRHGGQCPSEDSPARRRLMECNTDPCPIALLGDMQGGLTAAHEAHKATSSALESLHRIKQSLQERLPVLTCSAGAVPEMKEFVDSCERHNQAAKESDQVAVLLEEGFDECNFAGKLFSELMLSFENDLPWLGKQLCEADMDSAEITSARLSEQVLGVATQVEKCRERFINLKAKGSRVSGMLSGHQFDSQRSITGLMKKLKNIKAGDDMHQSQLEHAAHDLIRSEEQIKKKSEDLTRAREVMEKLQAVQADRLTARRDAKDRAAEEASMAHQAANNLDHALRPKDRDQARVDAAYREASAAGHRAHVAQQTYEQAVEDYNKATVAQQDVIRQHAGEFEDSQRRLARSATEQAQAKKEKLSTHEKAATVLHEIEILRDLRSISQSTDMPELDRVSSAFTSQVRGLSVKLDQWTQYIKTLHGQKKVPSAKRVCDRAKQDINFIVKSASGLFIEAA